ncbi:MAG: Glycerate dehydrogenase [Cyanobacteriota bacterium]
MSRLGPSPMSSLQPATPRRPRAVFLDALSLGPVDLSPLEAWCDLRCWPSTSPEQRLVRLADAEIAITNKIVLDRPLLERLPALRLICTASTGTDQVDQATCRERGIELHNAGRYSTASVVQVSWALILELCCRIQNRRERIAAGDWQRSPVFALIEPEFDELAGRTLVVLGAGTIGRGVMAIGEAFGMRVIGLTSRSSATELEQALRQADVLSLHAPLTPLTARILNRERLGWLPPGAVLVNAGRGGLVDLEALTEALRQGRLAGAALDVLACEPPGPELEPLLSVPNLLLTPHMAWSSRQARHRLVLTLAGHLQRYSEERRVSGS